MDYLGEEMDDDAVNERYRDLIEARYLLELRGPLGLTNRDGAGTLRAS